MRAPSWLGPLLLAACFAALTAWSWEKWADVTIDFGAELYSAWRISEGDVLYRDIPYRHGPLPHHLNALWFRLFGVSIRTLALCNLALLAVIAALTWDLFRRATSAWVATACTAVLLGVFAFGQYVPIANYNYVTPYQHHQTHGLLLCLGMLTAFGAAWRRSGRSALLCHALAGICLGGVFLTKLEIFVPAAAAAALALLLGAAFGRAERASALGAFAAGAALLPAAFFAWLALRMPPALALEGVLGNWAYLGGGLFANAFYRSGAGLDAPLANLLALLRAALGVALFGAAVLAVARLAPLPRARVPWLAPALALGVFAVLASWPGLVPWHAAARALPLTSAVVLGVLCVELWRRRGDAGLLARRGPLALYALLSLGLLGKMLLFARIEHYGFALAMPATLLLVAALFELAAWARGPRRAALARACVAGCVAGGVFFWWTQSDAFYRRKDFAVGQGADRVLSFNPHTSPRPQRVAAALARLQQLMPPRASLVVFPEGASLNYWLRKVNPSGYLLFLPTELEAFGEADMLARLEASPPDFAALVQRPSAEFGTGPFGVDPRNGRRLREWVDRHYERVARIGPEPFRQEGFGIVILHRRRSDSVP